VSLTVDGDEREDKAFALEAVKFVQPWLVPTTPFCRPCICLSVCSAFLLRRCHRRVSRSIVRCDFGSADSAANRVTAPSPRTVHSPQPHTPHRHTRENTTRGSFTLAHTATIERVTRVRRAGFLVTAMIISPCSVHACDHIALCFTVCCAVYLPRRTHTCDRATAQCDFPMRTIATSCAQHHTHTQ
jgi:hypothetical protein